MLPARTAFALTVIPALVLTVLMAVAIKLTGLM